MKVHKLWVLSIDFMRDFNSTCISMPGTSAALQYAVRHLEVEYIIVLGHANCGGVCSLFSAESGADENTEFIGAWMSVAENVRD